jgi:hypothetical protein
MAQNDTDARYLASLKQGTFSKEERLKLAQGQTFEGIPTPPRALAKLCEDSELAVRVQAKKSILRLSEQNLVQIAGDSATSPELLLFLAKHFHDSPAVGTAIIGNKKTTEKILYYLQGEMDDQLEERESIFAGGGNRQDVEFEVEDIVSPKNNRPPDEDVEVTVELDSKPKSSGGFSERERYSDNDMEVVIGVESGQDEIIDEHLLERNIDRPDRASGIPAEKETGPAGGSDVNIQDFSSTVDAIEGKFDDVFQIDRGRHDTEQSEPSIGAFEIEGIDQGTTLDHMHGRPGGEPVRPDTPDRQGSIGSPRVMMNETRKEVAVDTGKFVARLPMGRYFYKVSPIEIISRVIRISVPIIAVLVILTVFWFAMPTTRPPVEDLEGGVNRVFYSIRNDGLNPKIPDPFPPGSYIESWEFVKSSPESEVTKGGLKKAIETYTANFSEEIEYDDARNELSQQERTHKDNGARIAEIDETIGVLNADKTKYLSLVSKDKLDAQSIEEEYQKEVKIFKEDFNSLENQIKIIEQDTADAKRRIAEYESVYGRGGSDPAYIANKMEIDDLAARYSRLKPQYDKRKAGYDSRLQAIREQYQNMLDDTVWLETVEKNIKELQQEKIRLVSENKIVEKEVKLIKEKIKDLETERSNLPKLTGENLIMFLLLTHYMHEKGVERLNNISLLDRYGIYKTVSDVDVGLTGNGKEVRKRYKLTIMRLETEKSVILFNWNKESTTWVLTSITAVK